VLPDLTRPPSHLGPRREGWFKWFGGVVGSFVVLILCYSLLTGPIASFAFAVLLSVLVVVAIAVLLYSAYRLGVGNSVATQVYAARGGRFGDPEGGRRRIADREEITAYRDLRRRRISRIQYERILAYRRFVHGELTKSEYHQVLDFLAFHETHPSRTPRTSPRAG
jgi:hypothetical protein